MATRMPPLVLEDEAMPALGSARRGVVARVWGIDKGCVRR